MQALLGTRTSADLNLIAQLLILAGLYIGFFLARRSRFRQHADVQTTMVLVNLFFIAFVMAGSFYSYVIEGGTTTGVVAQLMMAHGSLGLLAEASGLYLILRMRTKLIPAPLRVANFKLVMRLTLALWTALVLLGVSVYYYRYLAPSPTVAAALGLPQLNRAGEDLVMHAVELRDAVKRANLETAKRHAEHVVNLVEGKDGLHYGDGDRDGVVEDPQDGTGLVGHLQAAVSAPNGAALAAQAEAVKAASLRLAEDAAKVLGAGDLKSVEPLADALVTAADRTGARDIEQLERRARELRVQVAPPPSKPVPGAPGQPNTATVLIEMFQYVDKAVMVRPGTTVVWVSKDQPKHTVTADDNSFKSGDLGLSETFSHTFNSQGTFLYYCRFHGDRSGVDMAGTVVVQ